MARTRAELRDHALYHLDMILYAMANPWDDRFVPIVEDARVFRDELVMEKISGKN